MFDSGVWFHNFFWASAVFLPVLLAIIFVVRPKIAQALKDREKGIEERIVEVEKGNEEAGVELDRFKDQLEHIKADADKILDEGRSDAEILRNRYLEEQKKEAEAQRKRMRREIELARDKALDDLHQETVRQTLERAAALIEKNLSQGDHKKLIEQAMAEAEAAASGKTA
jgi:F-type H+-transporting ATPase subunit b